MNLRELVERGDRPFASLPQVARYFPAATLEDARRRLGRAVERGEGPSVVIGGAGSGKSLLLQVLAAQYRERFDVVLLTAAQLCTRRALLQAIHFELGSDYRLRDEGQLRLNLLDQLLSTDGPTEGLLLLVDEAHALPAHLLEELRVLTNLARGGLPRVRLVIAGLSSLEEKLASHELESFSQRLAARCYVAPFTRDETVQYISAQLSASKIDSEQVIGAAARDAIFNATDGVPRLVNQLCDRSLLLAISQGRSQVDVQIVQAAWADLQQLPTPWETPSRGGTESPSLESVVEFGSLESSPNMPASDCQPHVAKVTEETADTAMSDSEPTLAPRPQHVEEPSLTFDVGRLADRISAMPLLNEESSVDDLSEATVLDDEENDDAPIAPVQQQSTAKNDGPRVRPVDIPDAVDPFVDPFDEEELVLDTFAALSGIFGTRTPRVENRRDPSFARFVEQTLESEESSESRPEGRQIDDRANRPLKKQPANRSHLRLAVVTDALNESGPSPERVRNVVAEAEELDFGPPDLGETAPQLHDIIGATVDTNAEIKTEASPANPISVEVADATATDDPAILVIEDDTSVTPLPPGARRESYRQLFSRLRHGA